jgi:hypothetical protein
MTHDSQNHCSRSQVKGWEAHALLGTLERADLNQWTDD